LQAHDRLVWDKLLSNIEQSLKKKWLFVPGLGKCGACVVSPQRLRTRLGFTS
jgi:hypothetical protein